MDSRSSDKHFIKCFSHLLVINHKLTFDLIVVSFFELVCATELFLVTELIINNKKRRDNSRHGHGHTHVRSRIFNKTNGIYTMFQDRKDFLC